MQTSHTPVAIVGAGPYGLSVAAHLSARGIEHRIFGRPMSLWAEQMAPGLFLKSEGHASNLSDPAEEYTLRHYAEESGFPYADIGIPVSRENFVAYGLWFQKHLVPHVETLDVTGLRRSGTRFEVEPSDGSSFTADRVVLGVGVGAFRNLPPVLQGLPRELASHSADHGSLSGFAGRRVVVLGGGQGALETAALLREAGADPEVLVRAPSVHWNSLPFDRSLSQRLRWPTSTLGTGWRTKVYAERPGLFRQLPAQTRLNVVRTALGPAGSWWLRDRVEGLIPISVATRVISARDGGDKAELTVESPEGRRTLVVDHVIAGTGFDVDLDRLSFVDPAIVQQVQTFAGFPVLTGGFESTVPGLHFVGLTAAGSFGPVQRFVCGAGFTARRLAPVLSSAGRSVPVAAPAVQPV